MVFQSFTGKHLGYAGNMHNQCCDYVKKLKKIVYYKYFSYTKLLSIMSTNCTAYDGMKYYLAVKKDRSNKWTVQPQAFLLHYTATRLTGQFITTMWYNHLVIDSEPMHYAILEVKKDATMMEKRMILDRLNQGNFTDAIYVDRTTREQMREAYDAIDSLLDSVKTENMSSTEAPPCKTYIIKMNQNTGISLNLTMQGTWETSNPEKHHYTLTLPMFEKAI